MVRYIEKQRHRMGCGPVAVINALKWYGLHRASYNSLVRPLKKVDVNTSGTYSKDISRALRHFGVRYDQTSYPTLRTITEALNRGNSVIFNYKYFLSEKVGSFKRGTLVGHIAFVDGHDKGKLRIHNACQKHHQKHDQKSWMRARLNRSRNLIMGPQERELIRAGDGEFLKNFAWEIHHASIVE